MSDSQGFQSHWEHGVITCRSNRADGQPVLFLHGVNGGAASWAHQAAGLSSEYRIIAWDAPGYGGSSPVEGRLDHFVDAVAALIRAQQWAPVAIVGHSFGGLIAIQLAAEFPELVKGLFLSCTHLGNSNASTVIQRKVKRLQEMQQMGLNEYGLARAKAMLPAAQQENSAIVDCLAAIASETRSEGVSSALEAIAYSSLDSSAQKLSLPITIVWTGMDPVVSLDKTDALCRALLTAETYCIENCGHAPYLEAPDTYNTLLESWLGKLVN